MRLMSQRGIASQPVAIALLGWLVPGLGYWLAGHRGRGVIVFISVVTALLLGILIGGIRVMDPPGWGQFGFKPQIVQVNVNQATRVDPHSTAEEANPRRPHGYENLGWALTQQPLAEIGSKPWSIGQIFAGPMYLAAAAVSVQMAKPQEDKPTEPGVPPSHSRSWELGTLYTAIAGMLNMLAMIDSTFRAAQSDGEEQ